MFDKRKGDGWKIKESGWDDEKDSNVYREALALKQGYF